MLPDTQETLAKARLYTLRIWSVRNDMESAEWRARLQDTLNGEVVYFKDWQAFINHMNSTFAIEKQTPNQKGEENEKDHSVRYSIHIADSGMRWWQCRPGGN